MSSWLKCKKLQNDCSKWLRLLLFFSITCGIGTELLAQEPFETRLAESIHYKAGEENTIGRIVIDDRQNGITQATWIYVNAALTKYKQSKPAFIILELNTPGGEVYSAQLISDALKEMDTQYEIPVIAYINNWAISAGAMLAYSCRFIVIAKDASMGAAEPVFMGEKGQMEAAPEKVNSALRTDFVNRAQFFGRNGAIAEAMVDKDVILVMRNGQIIKLENEDQIVRSDRVISPKGKLLTLSADQMIEYGVADKMLEPIKVGVPTAEEIDTGRLPIQKSQLSQISFFQKLAPAVIETFHMDWQTRFLAFLSTPAISSLLFLGLIIGLYIEISAGTFGVAGVVALVCLFFIMLSSFAMEAIHWLEPLLLLFGLFLIALEFFFFPTLGILGFIGTVLFIIGLGGIMLPGITAVEFSGDALNAAGQYVLERLGWLAGTFLVAVVIIYFLSRYMTPHIGLFRKLVLGDTPFLATGKHEMNVTESTPRVDLRVGDEAIVSVTLRPAGRIKIKDHEIEAVSTGSFIERGKSVKIIRVEGEKVMVEEIL